MVPDLFFITVIHSKDMLKNVVLQYFKRFGGAPNTNHLFLFPAASINIFTFSKHSFQYPL